MSEKQAPAETDRLQIGDVVQFIHGGPLMTVETVCDDGSAFTLWFARDDTLQRFGFRREHLIRVPRP